MLTIIHLRKKSPSYVHTVALLTNIPVIIIEMSMSLFKTLKNVYLVYVLNIYFKMRFPKHIIDTQFYIYSHTIKNNSHTQKIKKKKNT